CGRAEGDDGTRRDDGDLLIEPPLAPVDLVRVGALVHAPLAALLKLEVLDGIGDEDLLARHARIGERTVEHATGGADKRPARLVLAVARLLPYAHEPRRVGALARHHTRREAVERAARAPRLRGRQFLQWPFFRHPVHGPRAG